jgi:inorganic pyrophosphatase
MPTADDATAPPPELEVVIEVPRGSFLKRGSTGRIDFVSPLPCPFNYGAVPGLLGLEGDLLDALVLGPRLSYGTHTRVKAWAAVTLTDRGLSDDKLICSTHRPSPAEIERASAIVKLFADDPGAGVISLDGQMLDRPHLTRAERLLARRT